MTRVDIRSGLIGPILVAAAAAIGAHKLVPRPRPSTPFLLIYPAIRLASSCAVICLCAGRMLIMSGELLVILVPFIFTRLTPRRRRSPAHPTTSSHVQTNLQVRSRRWHFAARANVYGGLRRRVLRHIGEYRLFVGVLSTSC